MRNLKRLQLTTTMFSIVFMIISLICGIIVQNATRVAGEVMTGSGKHFEDIDPDSIVAGYEAVATASGFIGGAFIGAMLFALMVFAYFMAAYYFIPSVVGVINAVISAQNMNSDIPKAIHQIKSDSTLKIIFNIAPTFFSAYFLISSFIEGEFGIEPLILLLLTGTSLAVSIIQRINSLKLQKEHQA